MTDLVEDIKGTVNDLDVLTKIDRILDDLKDLVDLDVDKVRWAGTQAGRQTLRQTERDAATDGVCLCAAGV